MIDKNQLIEEIKKYHGNLKPNYISKLVDAVIEDIIDIINEQSEIEKYSNPLLKYEESEPQISLFDKYDIQPFKKVMVVKNIEVIKKEVKEDETKI